METITRTDNLPKGTVFLDFKSGKVVFCENEREKGFSKNAKTIASKENSFDYETFKADVNECELNLGLKPFEVPTEDTLEEYVSKLKSNGKYLKIK